ncbi:MAG: mechanosensitive ion channel family protein, partial [Pseudomonadota bacterium]
ADAAGQGRSIFTKVLQTLPWLAGAVFVISVLEWFLWRGVVARIARHPVPAILKTTVALIVLIIALAGIMSFVFNRDVTAIWATSGVVGLVLGFALRSMIQDVFTGIALNLDGSIREGDWISLHHRDFMQEQYGQVLDIGWRVSRVKREDNNVIVVPNGLLGTMAVTNYAHSEHVTRLQTKIVIDFDVPTERARRILLGGAKAAAVENGILSDPAPNVLVGDPEEHGAAYIIRFWGKVDEHSPSALKDAVMAHLLRQMHVAGLSPSLPKEDVFFERRPKRALAHDDQEDRAAVLSRTNLFAKTLQADEIAELAASADVREFFPGQTLVSQGEEGASLYVAAEGVLDVHITASDGSTLPVGHILAGDIFGEMSLLTGEPRSATVTASTGVIAYEVTRAQFEAVLKQRPAIAEEVSRIVAQRLAANESAASAEKPVNIETQERLLSQRILEGMAKVFPGKLISALIPAKP